ncbi:LysM peptidoglycan-binding domain-containing protein [Hyphococcus sp. DH-69]|uniref:LysM peptidoglycan-binding domain-containing protein n=1 Tax=Hyphococcus formosus TaxID=3143534 RepID=UPI00398BA76C
MNNEFPAGRLRNSRRALRTAAKILGASAIALGAAACASHDDFRYSDGYQTYDYGYDVNRYNDNYRTERRSFDGINGARVAHRLYSDARAERVDGDCEMRVNIERGETLSDIAEYCDVPVAAIIDANPHIRNPRSVSAGEILRIPNVRGNVYEGSRRYRNIDYSDDYVEAGVIETDRRNRDYYVVRRGDTLGEIARQFDVSLREIRRLNGRIDPYALQVGQRIYLPDYARKAPSERPRRDYVHYENEPPLVSISPALGPRDGKIRVIGENFRQGEQVTVFFGQDRDSLTKLKIVETDGDGRIDEYVRLPDSYNNDRAYFGLRPNNYDGYFMTEAYAIEARERPRNYAGNRTGNRTHVVRNGDSLAWLAQRYNVSMWELRNANPNVDFSSLQRGQRLRLPESANPNTTTGREPVMSAVQRSVYFDDQITLAAEGFPANTPVAIYGGDNRNRLEKISEVRSGPRGRFVIDVDVPENITGQSALFVAAIEDGPRTIFSERVRVMTRDNGRMSSRIGERNNAAVMPARSPQKIERGREDNRGWFSRFRKTRNDDYVGPVRTSPTGGVDSAGQAAIVGILTDEGEKCPALRDDAGNLFTLLGDMEGFDDGDRVLVRGSVQADDRICGQAETIQVFGIESAPW